MKQLIFLGLAAVLTLGSCKEKVAEAPAADPLYTEVMAMHDEVMPLTPRLSELKGKLAEFRTEQNSSALDQEIVKIDAAEAAMMTWMAEFKEPENKAEAQEYLEGEKQKIFNVAAIMNGALDRGKFLLDSLSVK